MLHSLRPHLVLVDSNILVAHAVHHLLLKLETDYVSPFHGVSYAVAPDHMLGNQAGLLTVQTIIEKDLVLMPSIHADAGLTLEAQSYHHHFRSELRGSI